MKGVKVANFYEHSPYKFNYKTRILSISGSISRRIEPKYFKIDFYNNKATKISKEEAKATKKLENLFRQSYLIYSGGGLEIWYNDSKVWDTIIIGRGIGNIIFSGEMVPKGIYDDDNGYF